MWTLQTSAIPGGQLCKLLQGGDAVTFKELIARWREDDKFCRWYSRALAALPFAAIYWEFPALTRSALRGEAIFAAIDAPELAATRAEPAPFAAHFDATRADIAIFDNLGGDAMLVVPCPRAKYTVYTHLLSFLRSGPQDQQRALWRNLGSALQDRLGDVPIWLNTAGLGVYWLHVRLDLRPKYYQFAPFQSHPDNPEPSR